ncbi:hypothetical protein ANN_16841 [Periplaneta americana]|uniref:Uncharacterized protein n=1 Tax=Periplaneta americana TaxID=6978 RepID=A0ABQ8SR85_PERAM|nr:hypothetical protein ANN_16841 [Periplaneta americana]
MDLREVGCDDRDWINLAQDRDRWRAYDIPLHVSMLSFLLIAVDRYRLMLDPTKPRMPAFVCALGTWLLAVCIVLPYPIYITYLDLGIIRITEPINDAIDKLNKDIDSIVTWTKKFHLNINPGKTQAIILGHKRQTDAVKHLDISPVKKSGKTAQPLAFTVERAKAGGENRDATQANGRQYLCENMIHS